MNDTFYECAMLFFTYSFFAWLAETAVATVKVKNFRNRGFASGPFCFLYGFTGLILTDISACNILCFGDCLDFWLSGTEMVLF